MYSIAMYLMSFGAFIGAIFSKKLRLQVKGQAKTFYILHKYIKKNDRVVWVHAASLGEFEQGRLLMELIRHRHPEYKILLTFFSPSGYEVRKDYEGADVICYLPFDTPGNAASFLRLAHPEFGILIKYEFWANYLMMAKHWKIPMYSVSSIFRPTQYFFRWYGNKAPLRCFTHFFVQNEESLQLLGNAGFNNVTVVGDTRFDRVILVRKMSANLPLVKTFCDGKPTFIAGSSWESDEEIYIPYFAKHKDWKLIIAPHKITGHHISQICSMLEGRKVVLYSEIEDNDFNHERGAFDGRDERLRDAEVLIVDFFGKLSSIYRYCDVALIGGGFITSGIHNVPEAAVYGVPTIFGPNNKKFQEAQTLLQLGGSFEFTDSATFAQLMDGFIADPESMKKAGKIASDYIYSGSGAVRKCYEGIKSTLKEQSH